MTGAFLPGNSTVELKEVPVPEPGHGEVLLRMKASTICGSDIRCIYHEHLGKGPEGYQGVVAGHEPLQVVKMKLTSSTLPRRSANFNVLPSWVVNANAGARRITARCAESAPGEPADRATASNAEVNTIPPG